jgi:putative glutamine amidotransferase
MKKKFTIYTLLIVLSFLCCCSKSPQQKDEYRYFNTAEQNSDEIVLTILYPSLGSIKALIELRRLDLFSLENLVVIGVFHEKERTDYQRSMDFVTDNEIEWLKFHKLRGDINRDNLFQKNPLTEEFKTIFKRSDGIILFGGADIPPSVYGEKTHLLSRVTTPYRNYMESSFIFHLLGGLQDLQFKAFLESSPQFPVLGICLGSQTLNVGTGGSLFQDIWNEIYSKEYIEDIISLSKQDWHTNPFARLYPEEKLFSHNMHPIKLDEEGKFVSDFGFKATDTPLILSAHHQAANKLGKGIRVAATSLDGKVVEAIEHEEYLNVLGVQFHPESPTLFDKTKHYKISPDDIETFNLLTLLETHTPSLAFHKEIWNWFGKKVKTFFNQKK